MIIHITIYLPLSSEVGFSAFYIYGFLNNYFSTFSAVTIKILYCHYIGVKLVNLVMLWVSVGPKMTDFETSPLKLVWHWKKLYAKHVGLEQIF